MISISKSLLGATLLLAFLLGSSFKLDAHESIDDKQEQLLPDYNLAKARACESFISYIESIMKTNYAPLAWKQEEGWSLKDRLRELRESFQSLESYDIDKVKQICNLFIDSTGDPQAGFNYCDERVAFLPIRLDEVDGKVWVIASIHPSIFLGDQVEEIEGMSPLNYASFALYNDQLASKTLQRVAALDRLCSRWGIIDSLKDCSKSLQIKLRREGDLIELEIPWFHIDSFRWHAFLQANTPLPTLQPLENEEEFCTLKEQACWIDEEKLYFLLKQNHSPSFFREHPSILGPAVDKFENDLFPPLFFNRSSSYLPESEIIEVNNQKVGLIRLKHFYSSQNLSLINEKLDQFERETDALVLDIRGCRHGENTMVFSLASRLIEEPIENLLQAVIINQSMVETARLNLDIVKKAKEQVDSGELSVDGYVLTRASLRGSQEYHHTIYDCWNEGQTFTPFIPLHGFEEIEPHPDIRYTKKLFLLVDERTASAGDVLAALLKDNHRAFLIGRTTAGEGSLVESSPINGFLGVDYLIVSSGCMARANEEVLENRGIEPHFFIPKTIEGSIDSSFETQKILNIITNLLQKENF